MDPAFSHDAFPLDDELGFNLFGENLIFLKNTWSTCHSFLFYFLKGKQNKKENAQCDSLFEKDDM